jgi:carbonic anhydrase/SulP family sulfate permease
MWLAGRQQFFPFVLTVIAIIVTDLLIGILIGMVIAIGFILYGNMRRPLRQVTERHVGGELTRIKLSNQVTFLNKASLMETLDQIPEQTHLVIDASETTHIDPDVVDLISDYQQETAPARNIQLSLVGFQSPILKNDLSHDLSVSTQDIQAKVTPSEVLQLMKEGNARFVRGEKVARNLIQQVDSTSQAQYPLATVLACMDSRVATEMIFDLGIGDIFSVRVAGNIAVDRTIGSCEYGCAVAGAKLLLVLGHTRCGAVMSSIDLAHQGKSALEATGCEHLDSVTSEITQVISADTTSEGERTSANTAFVDSITEANVRRNMHQLMEKSSRIRGLVEDGSLLLVGAVYNVKTGAVTFLED